MDLCGHGQGPNIIQYHFMSLPGHGKGLSFSLFWEEYSFLAMGKAWWVKGLPAIVFHHLRLGGYFACKSPFVHFSLGYCCCSFSYLMDDSNKWFLTYLCLLSPTEGERGVRLMVLFSVEVLNWRIPFLNYNIKSRQYFSH